MKPLVLDIGGTNVKAWSPEGQLIQRLPTGKQFTPRQLVAAFQGWCSQTKCDAVAIGMPAPVVSGRPSREPWNLGAGWVDFDYEGKFGLPVRMINDAAMQALGAYERGSMLFLGLGTSVGSTLIVDGFVVPMELGGIPYSRNRSLEDMLCKKALHQSGQLRWRKAILRVLPKLHYAFGTDYVVLGGGNAGRVRGKLPDFVRVGGNRDAYIGGLRLWQASDYRRLHWIPPEAVGQGGEAPVAAS
jgi:hypothetical protein